MGGQVLLDGLVFVGAGGWVGGLWMGGCLRVGGLWMVGSCWWMGWWVDGVGLFGCEWGL